jgi:2-isopropylmalate synthase
MSALLEIYDTTLRDGTQGEGINLSLSDKLHIAERLDALGIDYIEGGWPGSNPKDAAFFRAAATRTWKHATIYAFGSTRRPNCAPEDDVNLKALVDSGTSGVTIVGKSWTHHVTEVLNTTFEENLAMIAESVAYLRAQGLRVIYDAEHFFDGFKADPAYALATLKAAANAGAATLVLCDTNGGNLPETIASAVRAVRDVIDTPVGIHTHNDCELAVANTLAGVQAGASHVQGTFNGYGERCGNANLCSIIPNLELKFGIRCLPEGALQHLTEAARYVGEVANRALETGQPYVGHSAFAHKGGIHVSAMRRSPIAYQHVDPVLVGNTQRTLISELSGRANVQELVERVGSATLDGARLSAVVEQVKSLENEGFSFESAEASVHLLVQRTEYGYMPPFSLVDFLVVIQRLASHEMIAQAMLKLDVNGTVVHTAADGNGPVNALDLAARKALRTHYPQLDETHLMDYKVRVLDGHDGTAATVRVLIESGDEQETWSTVGSSQNIIEASWIALSDSLEFAITRAQAQAAG